MDKEAQEKLTKARAGLVLDQPFFASIALRMESIEDSTAPTMYTDGKVIGYNPEWVKALSLDELKGVTCHEVMHIALLHNLRRDERNHDRWNIAADFAVNGIIEDAGLTLPPGKLRDSKFDNLEAEAIYPYIHAVKQSSGDPGKCGEIRDFPSPSGKAKPTSAELAQQEQDQKIATQQALNAARQAGSLPGSLERLINDLLEPIIPWKEVLARFVDTNACNDYTWTMPNKRYLPQGIYLPALRNPELGHILLAVDTSGSITQTQLNEFISEIKGILRAYDKTQLTVIFCDHTVQGESVTLETDSDSDLLKPKGGGGTSFKPPFEWAEENGIQPKAAIYLTDGYCHSFPEVPEYETLWVLTKKNESFRPPFGEIIYIER